MMRAERNETKGGRSEVDGTACEGTRRETRRTAAEPSGL